jgi:hypothetical protein
MDEQPYLHVVIIIAKCSKKAGIYFGVRMEEKKHKEWVADWAFAIKEKTIHNKDEGYIQSLVSGKFSIDAAYPGCPSCNAKGFFKCQCGYVNCWDCDTKIVVCSWCNHQSHIDGNIESLSVNLDAGAD